MSTQRLERVTHLQADLTDLGRMREQALHDGHFFLAHLLAIAHEEVKELLAGAPQLKIVRSETRRDD